MPDVTAVVVTLRDSPKLRRAIASVRAATDRRTVETVCVVNAPDARGTWMDDGVRFVGAGMNLGWAAGMHAGIGGSGAPYMWAIQDDLEVAPGSLDILCAHLESDDGLASVRPLTVGPDGMVGRGGLGGTIDDDTGLWTNPNPPSPVPASSVVDPPSGSFLASSGQLIRRAAWDAVGGFDPWFYPWGFIDIDFARSLRSTGWRFAHSPAARMRHRGGASTSSLFRMACHDRNRSLFVQKWVDGPIDPSVPTQYTHPGVVAEVRAGRGSPRVTDLPTLQSIAGRAAADLSLGLNRWMDDRAHYHALRTAVRESDVRRRVVRQIANRIRRTREL